MDNNIGKRASTEHVFSRRGSGVTLRDVDHNGKSTQHCNRLGCSTRHNYLKSTQIGAQEKLKTAKPSLRPIRGKEKVESSSRAISDASSFRKSLQEHKNTSLRQSYVSGSSSREEDTEYLPRSHRRTFIEDFESNYQPDDNFDSESTSVYTEGFESAVLEEASLDTTQSPVHCSGPSNSKPSHLSIGRHDAPSSSFVWRPTAAYRSSSHAAKPVTLGWGAGAGKQSSTLKNLRCTSISDVLPSGCSSSGYSRSRTVDIARKRLPIGESSSSRSKGVNALSDSAATRPSISGSRLTIPERAVNQPVSRRTRDRPALRETPVSVRTRRTPATESRMMLSLRGNDGILSEAIMAPQVTHSELSIPDFTPENSSRSFTMEMPRAFHSTSGRPGSSHRSTRSRVIPHSEDEDSDLQIFSGSLGSRDGYRRFNMEGVAEMLLALERIEQDEALSYEQLLVLETSLLLGGLSFHDQHRDMRLDIDNMSYEELLALEEKMGSVSTALSEEQLSKCLTRSIYEPAVVFPESDNGVVDDVKCSICQEEYVGGDQLGNLLCKHRFHVPCIQHWLKQKNWCPICKSCSLPS